VDENLNLEVFILRPRRLFTAKMPLSSLLTEARVRRRASATSYARGQTYCHDGRVQSLVQRGETLTASVLGTQTYSVRLAAAGGSLEHRCSCPVGADGEFCKHSVAVALAWLADRKFRKSEDSPDTCVNLDDVHPWLLQQEKSALAAWLLEAAERDASLRERLLRHAARAANKRIDFSAYRRAIDRATAAGDFVSYDEASGMANHIHEAAIEPLRELLQEGHAAAVVDLAEHALRRVEDVIEHVDDSDGHFGTLLHDLQELHLAACRAARPDPETLAERLFDWEIGGDRDVFYNAAETYVDVFGEKGLAVYRARAEARWKSLPLLKPGESEEYSSERFRLTAIMETLARTRGDLDALVAIKQKNLSHAYAFLEIAQLYREARRHDDALAWTERGVNAFPKHPDPRLQEFLASEYHRRGRHDDAIALGWRQFDERPSLETYRLLKTHADRVKPSAWSVWRERALEHLPACIAKAQGSKPSVFWSEASALRSTLVEIFLFEKDANAAWTESQAGACDEKLLLRVAAVREKTHPADAIPIYLRRAEWLIEQRNNRAYEDAVGLLRKVKALHLALGQPREWVAIRARLCVEHKAKRNFMALVAGL